MVVSGGEIVSAARGNANNRTEEEEEKKAGELQHFMLRRARKNALRIDVYSRFRRSGSSRTLELTYRE